MSNLEEIYSIISLICPLGQKRIKIPVKGENCQHKQVFDKETLLEVYIYYIVINVNENEQFEKFLKESREKCKSEGVPCPVCCKLINGKKLKEDEVYKKYLESVSEVCEGINNNKMKYKYKIIEIKLFSDGKIEEMKSKPQKVYMKY